MIGAILLTESESTSSSLERYLCVSQYFFCDWLLWRYEDEFRLLIGVALLWCNFSRCSWQLLVESKLKTSWFKYHSGEDQQRTVKLGLSYGNMRLSQLTQMCFIWHSLSLVPGLNRFIWKNSPFGGNELQVLTEEQAFGFLVSSVLFSSFVTIRLLKLTLMSSSNFFGFSHRNQKSRGNILSCNW